MGLTMLAKTIDCVDQPAEPGAVAAEFDRIVPTVELLNPADNPLPIPEKMRAAA